MSNSVKMFKVFYLVGGWANMVCNSLTPLFTEEQASHECLLLNKMGYPAQKIEFKGKPIGGYFVSYNECADDVERKKYYEMAKSIGFAPINQNYGF